MDEPTGAATDEAIDLLWHSPELSSMEHFSFRPGAEENTLAGTVVLPREGAPTTIRYQVSVGPDWGVRATDITVTDPKRETRTEITSENGSWWVDHEERPELAGCIDVDLGWTPSTNTLPIRRTSLPVSESITVLAAWVTFPDLTIRPSRQQYERIDELTWTYRSGDFAAELATDRLGFVTRYGKDIWFTVASSNTDTTK